MNAINHHTSPRIFTLLMVLCCSVVSFTSAQVGVGTTTPNATLDIEASNMSSPANNDGILIPRVDNFPSTNPTADQDGMMIFVTGNGTPTKGFYYWDHNTSSWMSIQGVSDSDWFEENTSSPPNSNTDDIFTNGFVGIGKSIVQFPLDISEDSSTRTLNLLNTNNSSSTTGIRNELVESNPSANGSSNGLINRISRTNQTSVSGVSNSFTGSEATNSFGYIYGYQNSFGGSTSNTTFATINRFQGTTTTANGTVNLIGGPITNFYGVDNHNIPGGILSGTFYGLYNSLTGIDNGNRYGVYTSFEETGTGDKYGEFISIPSSAGGNHFGVYSDVQKTGSYAAYFVGRSSFGDNTTNRYELPPSDGNSGQVLTTDGSGNLSFQDPTTIDDADWYAFGTSSPPSNINSSIYTLGQVGIGNTSPSSSLDILYDGFSQEGVNINYNYTGSLSPARALDIESEASNAVNITGAQIRVINSSSAVSSTGVYGWSSANATSNIGLRGNASGSGNTNFGVTGSASQGTFNFGGEFSAISAGSINYGIRAYALNATTNWAGFFGLPGSTNSGNVYVQDLLEVDGSFNYTDGNEALGQILASDATGNASWIDPNSIFTDTSNTLDQAYDQGGAGAGRTVSVDSGSLQFIGTGANDFTTVITNTNGKSGIELNVSGDIATGPGITEQGIEINNSINTNGSFANNYGVFNRMTVSGSAVNGSNMGFRNWFLPGGSAESNQYGFYADNQNIGGGDNYGFYNRINNDGNGTKYGLYSRITGAGSGDKYGVFSQIDVTTGGTHYGIYSVVPDTNSFAGYFFGRLSLGDGSTGRYILPSADGTSGQVMMTDGSGNITFQDVPITTDTDDQFIDVLSLNGTSLEISLENDAQPIQTLDLSSLQDGTGTDNQTLSIAGNILSIQNGNSIDLGTVTPNTDNQQIDNLNLSGTSLVISLQNDGVPPQTVDLAAINSDNQQIDSFAFNSSTNILSLEVEDDGQVPQTVDLSSLNPTKSIARIFMSTSQTETGAGTTKVNFDTVDFDTNSNYNTTTDEFTVPADGLYRVTAQITLAANTGTGSFGVRVRVNGTQQRRSEFNHVGNGTLVRQVTSILNLTAGQTLDVSFVRPGTGATIEPNSRATFFEIEQL